jgi:hypothetical protein
MTIVIMGAIAIFLGKLFLGEEKTSMGILAYGYAALIYWAAVVRIGNEKASRLFLYVLIASIPFPFLVQFQGKDAATVTTLLILSLAALIAAGRLVNKDEKHRVIPGMYWYLPLCIGACFTLSVVLNPQVLGQSIRYYVANISGILIYLAIMLFVHTRKHVVAIVNIILAALLIQCAFSFIQLKFPHVAEMLNIFGTRVGTHEAMFVEGMERVTGTIGDYELLAQWFLIGGILSFYMIFETRKYLYCAPLLANMAGMVLTKTRSGMILFTVSFIFIFIIIKIFNKDRRSIANNVAVIMIAGVCLMAVFLSSQAQEAITRIKIFMSYRDIFSPEAINRDAVWKGAESLLRQPTLFGNGLFNVETKFISSTSFHSLYFTLLYKVGLVGFVFHAAFWLFLFNQALRFLRRTRNSRSWYAVFFFSVVLIVMLIDGIKIEYLRYAHTIQFAWVMFALHAVLNQQKVHTYENTMVCETTV